MSVLEKELADIIIYYEQKKAEGILEIPIGTHLDMAHAWLKREQGLRTHVHSYVPKEEA